MAVRAILIEHHPNDSRVKLVEDDICQSLTGRMGTGGECAITTDKKTFTEKRFFEWHEDDKSVTLRNKAGSYGGGSEVFVIEKHLTPVTARSVKVMRKHNMRIH